LTAARVIELLDLRRLPEEGGFYAETYRGSALPVGALPVRYGGQRPTATAIYYLVTPTDFSALHRLPGDELFHFYLGDPVERLHLLPDGSGRVVVIGPDLETGQRPQVLAPGGVWQGTRLLPGGAYGFALLGTTMAPGFDFADYEGGRRDELIAAYPRFRGMIEALTR
jgi:predicted cupin superfamily sugar epimerase